MREKKQLEWSLRADQGMDNIHAEISADNPAAADRVYRHLFEAAEGLIDFPMIGHTGKRSGTRELVMTKYPYILVYRVTSSKVRIVAVYHQRQIIQGDQSF